MPAPKPLPTFKIIGNHIRLSSGADGTTWPWPFFPDSHDQPAHRARYSPELLTKEDAMYLAGVHDAYCVLITHPCRSVRDTLHVLHRISETREAEKHLDDAILNYPRARNQSAAPSTGADDDNSISTSAASISDADSTREVEP